VLQCNGGTNNVSNIIIWHIDDRKLLLICILLLSHSLIFFRFLFYKNMVVIYVFFWKRLRILIVVYVYLSLSIWCLCILWRGYPDWGFSVLFPQLKGKCQGITSQDGARPALSQIFVLFYVLFVLCRSVYCSCVNVYCITAIGNCS